MTLLKFDNLYKIGWYKRTLIDYFKNEVEKVEG